MDVVAFVSELLNGLALLETVQDVTSQAEGPPCGGGRVLGEICFWHSITTR
jgi:hypothetical protein